MNGINANEEVLDGTGLQGARIAQGANEFMYVYAPEAKAKGEVQVIAFDGDEETNPRLADAATATFKQTVCVVLEAITAAGFVKVQTRGYCQALVDGTTDVAKDDFLEVINGAVSATKDGSSRSTVSLGIACEARSTDSAGLIKIFLLGEGNTIAAS